VAVIGGGIVIAVILFLGGNGGGNNACNNALPPLGKSDISQAGFQAEDAGLAKVIQAASAGNLPAVEDAFYGEVHGFTHNADQPLRPVDEELARELCRSVIDLEEELFAEQPRVDTIATLAARIRALLRDAAEALGYVRPGG
jgi:hypothetical protein